MKTLLFAAGFTAALTQAAFAADYPSRPLTWIVPFAAGGVTDIMSRKLAERLGAELGQPVIVENKPGAGGLVGTKEGQMAPADGYTLTYATSGPVGIQPALNPEKLKYDPLGDFAYIHGVTISPQLLVASASAPFNTIGELVTYAQANPGKLNFGSPGLGTAQHLGGELFKRAAKIEMEHIPYTAGSTQMVDLAAGVIDISFDYLTPVAPYVQDGRMKIIASTATERSPSLADVPTVVEAGYPDAVNLGWTFVAVPKDTPVEIRTRLEEAMAKILAEPDVRTMIEGEGRGALMLKGNDAGQAFVASEIAKFKAAAEGIDLK